MSLLVFGALAFAGWQALLWAEAEYPEHLPWTPLSLAHPPGMATAMKVAALSGDKPACLALFEESPLAVTPIDDRMESEQCGLVDAVALETMTASYNPGTVRLGCPLAASLAIWEQHVVQPAAERLLGSPVATIDHYGTYSCRRLYGRSEGRWSAHATAEAIDITGFRLEDGRRIQLKSDWTGDDETAAFLRVIRDEGCSVFGTLLGPDYNAAHADHFHLQVTGFGTCR
jgi:hypothetical protein